MSLKLIVMGVGGVGKSAISNRFVINRWVEKYDPTIEESFQTTVDIDGKALQVEILDTAGQEEYRPLRETFMHTGDGFLFVYSLTDDQTLEELRDIREEVRNTHPNPNVPIVVVANKADLAAQDRAVSLEEGAALAEEFDAGFLEVSAKQNLKVKQAFEMLIRMILKSDPSAGTGGSGAVFGAGSDHTEKDLEGTQSSLPSSLSGGGDSKKAKVYNPITSKKKMCMIL